MLFSMHVRKFIVAVVFGVDTFMEPTKMYVSWNQPRPTERIVVGVQQRSKLVDMGLVLPQKWSQKFEVEEAEVMNFPLVSRCRIQFHHFNNVIIEIVDIFRKRNFHDDVSIIIFRGTKPVYGFFGFGKVNAENTFSWCEKMTTTILFHS